MIRRLNTNSILENRIAKLEKRLHIKNESKLDIVDAIHMGLDDDLINESQLINECLAIMSEEELMTLCTNLDIPF